MLLCRTLNKARILLLYIFFIALFPAFSYAFTVEEKLSDAALEKRAQSLFAQIRCVVCVSQSIADSDTSLAQDMRRLVRKQIQEGKSDVQILAFLVRRYGQEVTFAPPVKGSTFLLWAAPFMILLAGLCVVFLYTRQRPATNNRK